MRWGIGNEDMAAYEYADTCEVGITMRGFVIDPQTCWLGATPDRFLRSHAEKS